MPKDHCMSSSQIHLAVYQNLSENTRRSKSFTTRIIEFIRKSLDSHYNSKKSDFKFLIWEGEPSFFVSGI
jgi:hypothetical protein